MKNNYERNNPVQISDKELQEIKEHFQFTLMGQRTNEFGLKLLSTIEGLRERNKPLDDKLIQEIAEKCTDLNKYDDDDFTPPESVPGDDDEEFWDWIQDLLRTSAKNALGMVSDGIFSEVEGLKGEVERLKEDLRNKNDDHEDALQQVEKYWTALEWIRDHGNYESICKARKALQGSE